MKKGSTAISQSDEKELLFIPYLIPKQCEGEIFGKIARLFKNQEEQSKFHERRCKIPMVLISNQRYTGGNYCGAERLEHYMNHLEHCMQFASCSAQHHMK